MQERISLLRRAECHNAPHSARRWNLDSPESSPSTMCGTRTESSNCSTPAASWCCDRERLIRLCLVEIRHRGGAVDHRVTTRAEFGRGLLQIVPMLDDQTIFEAKDVEADAWPEEVVFRVSEDIIAVFKDTDGVD